MYGYAGRRVEDLARWVHRWDAVVLDIRNNPRSSLKGWNDFELVPALGRRYQRCRAWGNVNYKATDMPHEIVDFDSGWADVQELRTGPRARRVVLMCACRDHAKCHRSTIEAMILERHGIRCGVLELPDAPAPPRDPRRKAVELTPQMAML
jgi:hypothetical protein